MRVALTILALLATSIVIARSDGIYNPSSNSVGDYQGIDSNAASGVAPSTNFLLANTSVTLLVDTGVKFKVQ